MFTLSMWSAFFEWLLLCASCDCGLHINIGPLNAVGSATVGPSMRELWPGKEFPIYFYGALSFVAYIGWQVISSFCCTFPLTKNDLHRFVA